MLTQVARAQACWGGVHSLIDRWLGQRLSLLESFDALQSQGDSDLEHMDRMALDRFGEELTDYVSLGHFELYPKLYEECQLFGDQDGLDAGHQLLANLDPSTQLVLDFNDAYANEAAFNANQRQLPGWLARLERGLRERFELEDALIARLHAVHTQTPQDASSAP
ncbi:Rsd/AlgQ family anti-sigma factor [Larsenimonas suaedae]|uniref:Rsd/AlgQ family anti-sigma factor n=1 Tax=Larsenimonas suaedae TaxID=1851019 RepID=A0ABU1GWJ7_9GAMM|nr:Rsd/AlgQ family anti-sigma factor [Larsenimonas suaedae]MCM2972942.1 Rsd/AlgQ family anti-sigma factor [Larsenimonas suaedae]MDR5896379.1 Rsd/AlgQ family anti-sigma factor [Larsenimonas suaedae]